MLGLLTGGELAGQRRVVVEGDRFATIEDLEATLVADLLSPGAEVALMRFDSDRSRDLAIVAARLGPRARVAEKQACRACTGPRIEKGDIPAGGALALFAPRVGGTDTVGVSIMLTYDRAPGHTRQVGAQVVARDGQWVVRMVGGRIITSRPSP